MSDGGVQMLRLSPAQEEQLLQLRKKHLRNLRNLYEDRQRLNLGVSQLSTHSGNAKQATPDFAVYLPNGAGLCYLLSKAEIDASCGSKMSESAGISTSHTKLVDHGEINRKLDHEGQGGAAMQMQYLAFISFCLVAVGRRYISLPMDSTCLTSAGYALFSCKIALLTDGIY